MLSSFISYIPKGPKRKTKNLTSNRLPGNAGPGGARGATDGGEYVSCGGLPASSWDYVIPYAHRYNSSQVLDIRDGHPSSSRESRQHPSEEFLQAPPPSSSKLDLDIPSSRLPPDLNKGDPFTLLMEGEIVDDARSDSQRPWVADLGADRYQSSARVGAIEAHEQERVESPPSASSASSEAGPSLQPAHRPVVNDDDEESLYSLEYVNFDPDAPPISPRPELTEVDDDTLLPYASTSRKPAPAPIQIPNLSLYSPKVQLLPSSSGYQSRPQSRGNESIVSTEPSSAVSGTSLARALFANTFILSSGNQTSRYRSGVSMNLARQDSATLPRGEHPLMSSPFLWDRPEHIGSPIMIPVGSGVSLPPPSSYRPSTADSMHRRLPRRSGPDPRDRPKTAPGKRVSARSLPARTTGDADCPSSATEMTAAHEAIPQETGVALAAAVDSASRRISRISEAASSTPSTPDPTTVVEADKGEAPEQPDLAASTSTGLTPLSSPSPSPSGYPRTESATEKDVPDIALSQDSLQPSPKDHPEAMPQPEQEADKHPPDVQPGQNPHHLGPPASPGPTPHSAGGFSISSEPGSGKEIDNVLDYYQSESHPTTFPTLRIPFSPISEESSSMLSPASSHNKSASGSTSGASLGGDSKMSQQQNAARLSVAPTAVRAQAEWSPRKPMSPPLLPAGGRELPRRPGLLPIGERPKSFQVGPPPISLTSPPLSATSSKLGTATFSASTATSLSSLASPENGEPLLPPPRSIFNRARSGSAPSPIKVIRTSRDLRRLPVAVVTPLTGDSTKDEEESQPVHTEDADKTKAEAEEQDVKAVGDKIMGDAVSPNSSAQSIERSASQEFPETPSAFSPTWSFNMMSPSTRGQSTHEYPVLMPMSTGMPSPGIRGSIQPASLTQQVLLTRAATSVRGARHSRQASLLRNATVPAAKVEISPDGQRILQPLIERDGSPPARPVSLKRPLSEMEEEPEPDFSGSPILPGTHHMVTEEPTELDIRLPEEISPSLGQHALPEVPIDVSHDDILFSPRIPVSPVVRPQRPRMGDPVLPSIFDPLPSTAQRSASSGSMPATPSLSIHSAPSPRIDASSSFSKDRSHPSSPRSIASSSRHPLSSNHSDSSSVHRLPSPVVRPQPASNFSSPHLSPAQLQGRIPDTTSIRSPSSIRSVSPSSRSFSSHSSPHLPPASPARSPVIPIYASHSDLSVAAFSHDSSRSVRQPTLAARPPPLSLNTHGSPELPIVNTPSNSYPSSHPLSSPYVSHPGDLDLDHPLSPSFVAPPPYSSVADSNHHEDMHIPFTGGGSEYRFGMAQTPSSANSHVQPEPDPRTPLSAVPRRPRVRPPLPIGPRRPQQVNGHLATGVLDARQRNASVPNLASSVPVIGGRHHRQYSAQVPKFRTPTPKWRGYTLEAAKWTFSSSELQAIVSRAIRQSAEASAFRLLQLDTLDNDIAREMEALTTQRADIKTKYKLLTRRRAVLFDTISAHLEGAVLEYSVPPLHVLDELNDVSTNLDQLAEELDSVDEQICQLTSLCEVHSSSALAMALRKLNTSFLKQVSENSSLKARVEALEAERDEAWKQAQEVANDYDDLCKKVDSAPPESASCRSSRVMASRKTSIRASKAGLRSTPSIRRSQRSSVSSNGQRVSVASLASGTLSPGEVPPVPPIPRKPSEIVTDLPTRASSGVYTPNSETRAMHRAQEELYDMLGIPMNAPPPLRRSHSVSDRPVDLDSSILHPTIDPSPRYSDASSGYRRSSMPNNPGLHQVYNAMTVDRKAMLATLGILSDQT